jgi:5-methylcytosine-specific restriction enzyme B
MEFFNEKDFSMLTQFAGSIKDKNNPDHEKAYQYLRDNTYKKVGEWAKRVQKSIFPNGGYKIMRRPIDQFHSKFGNYHWAKIYPDKQSMEDSENSKEGGLAFIVDIHKSDDGGRLHAKIDTVKVPDPNGIVRTKYEKYRDKSAISKVFSKELYLNSDEDEKAWEVLTNATTDFFEGCLPDYEYLQKHLFGKEMKLRKVNFSATDMTNPKSLNTILYGPPGTGKTYHTLNQALEILSHQPSDGKDRKELKEEFKAFQEKKKVAFTTFHQSFSYEDFIEGIKPVLDSEEDDTSEVRYTIEAGLFKRMAVEAYYEYYLLQENGDIRFDNLYNAYADHLSKLQGDEKDDNESVDFEYRKKINSKTGKGQYILSVDQKEIKVKPKVGEEYSVDKVKLKEIYKKYPASDNLEKVTDLTNVTNPTAYRAVFLDFKDFEEKHRKKDFKYKLRIMEEQKVDFSSFNENELKEIQPYVLIIDEINRGNVARIFGELITLLEPDKRAGEPEETVVTLPYSKKPFCVPPNLYIIGTMNTADRSVEALDTALRRRFTFRSMPSKSELLSSVAIVRNLWVKYEDFSEDDQEYRKAADPVIELLGFDESKHIHLWENLKTTSFEDYKARFKQEEVEFKGINLEKLIKTLNERLTILLDEDHTIGHAWFMDVQSIEDLKKTMGLKVIPLLQEFFFKRAEKARLVLGDGFVKKDSAQKVKWPEGTEDDNLDLDAEVYSFIPVMDMDDDKFIEALRKVGGGIVGPAFDTASKENSNEE